MGRRRRRRRRRIRWRWRLRDAVRPFHVDVVERVLYHGSLFVEDVIVAIRSIADRSHDRVALCRCATGLKRLLERTRNEWEDLTVAHVADLDGIETARRGVWRGRRRWPRRRCWRGVWRGRRRWRARCRDDGCVDVLVCKECVPATLTEIVGSLRQRYRDTQVAVHKGSE